VFLYPGTLNQHQGLDIAIRAFAMSMDRMPNAEFHIYGEGPDRPMLEALVVARGLTGRVKLKDRVALTDVATLMAAANAGIVPKRADGFGNEAFSTKILEFMACGVPVIVSRTRVDAYYFDDNLVRFFTPGDDADLSRVMLAVYESRDHHQEWISAARQFAIEYSWQQRAQDYLAIVDRLTSIPPATRTVTG
jgi:glycosyltransferase involved in cell wall biosynthesis